MVQLTFNALKLNQKDNVVVTLKNVKMDEYLSVQGEHLTMKVLDGIPYGHKIAIADIPKGGRIIKYGEWMGVATQDIQAGTHVHVSNVRGLNDEERQAIKVQ